MNQKIKYKMPSVTTRSDGSHRLVGYELEFSGLSLEQTVDCVCGALGGKPGDKTAAEQIVNVESLGDFNIEIDWDFLKRKAREKGNNINDNEWLDQLSKAASLLVPVEVVSPPISITNMDVLDNMVKVLRKAGAVGTEESLIAAYGVHINTDIPQLDSQTLFAYLRSFALLQWWLVKAHHVNTTRKLSPYIDLYPEEYVKLLASQSTPSMDDIFDDYLKYNPSRNRALDMLPILAEIDKKRVFKSVNDPKIQARPAFHYRLPNCTIEQQDWSLAQSWNIWWVVDELANRPDALELLSRAFLEAEQPIVGVICNTWVEFLEQWLTDHELV